MPITARGKQRGIGGELCLGRGEVAHRMVFMHEGSLIEEGPPAELVTGARDPRTRRFLEAVL